MVPLENACETVPHEQVRVILALLLTLTNGHMGWHDFGVAGRELPHHNMTPGHQCDMLFSVEDLVAFLVPPIRVTHGTPTATTAQARVNATESTACHKLIA